MKNYYTLLLYTISTCILSASSNPDFTLAPNGITCLCPNAAIGSTGT